MLIKAFMLVKSLVFYMCLFSRDAVRSSDGSSFFPDTLLVVQRTPRQIVNSTEEG